MGMSQRRSRNASLARFGPVTGTRSRAASDREWRIGPHADIDLRTDHLRIAVSPHDADYKLTEADFDLAAWIAHRRSTSGLAA